jgi:hydroxyethylthiazole kinase-like uncharacterized protein yjeF
VRIATVEQSREIDRLSQQEYNLSGEILMEAAGSGAAREIEQAFFPELKRGLIGVVCGPGNNGADGLVVARHLHSAGHRDLCVFLAAPTKSRSDLFKLQLDRVDRLGLRIVDVFENPEQLDRLRSCVLIVDALFGIGLKSDLESGFVRVIEAMNANKCPVVSLDTPSGLDCDRGTIASVAVRAAMTTTFGLAKPGFFVNEGPSRVGRLRILPIGFPFEVFRKVAVSHFGFSEKLARRYLPKRKDTSNKSDHGHLVVFAGRAGTWGAGLLASVSAYRMGVGYVTLASFDEPVEAVRDVPEVLTARADDLKLWNPEKWKAVAIGPGLGVGSKTAELINRLRTAGVEAVVVDADAITTCVEYDLFPLPKNWVLTPHAGELSRILKIDAKTIEKDRFTYALQASRQTGCHVLLKGFRSVLAYQDRCMVIMSGNSALAKAGTGDVLTGMIAGLLAQHVDPVQATATAAYIHGRMADEWVRSGNDKRSLTASDLRDHLPQLMARLAGGGALV